MNRKQRTILLLVVSWSVVIGVPGVWLWRADRQERLNRQLIAAINRKDTAAALVALDRGADANTRDEPMVPAWQRLWDLVWRRKATPSATPTALLLLLGERDGNIYGQHRRDSLELVDALLAHGARVNVIGEDDYRTPLSLAAEAGQMRIVALLIEHGANVNYMVWDTIGDAMTPLAWAVEENDTAMVRLLLRHHANSNVYVIEPPHPRRLLTWAEGNCPAEIAQLLHDAGAKR